jgi:hypothetical protein
VRDHLVATVHDTDHLLVLCLMLSIGSFVGGEVDKVLSDTYSLFFVYLYLTSNECDILLSKQSEIEVSRELKNVLRDALFRWGVLALNLDFGNVDC